MFSSKLIVCTALMALAVPTLYAFTGYGACHFDKQAIDDLTCFGTASLNGTTILGNTNITGPTKANGATFNALTITGPVHLRNSLVKGNMNMVGFLQAQNVHFQKDVSLVATQVRLHHSTVDGAITTSSDTETPRLRVECGSTITGAITFKDKPGLVEVTEDSTIKGKIENGTTSSIQQNCKSDLS